jgi:hypothetical protein
LEGELAMVRKVVELPEEISKAVVIFRANHPEIQSDKEALEAMFQEKSTAPDSSSVVVNPPVERSEFRAAKEPLQPERLTPHYEREKIVLRDTGEEYYPCELGAMDVKDLEITFSPSDVALRIEKPSRCPVICENPNISSKRLIDEFCKKTKEVERCPILQQWERWQVILSSYKLKLQLGHEKNELLREKFALKQAERKALPPPPDPETREYHIKRVQDNGSYS